MSNPSEKLVPKGEGRFSSLARAQSIFRRKGASSGQGNLDAKSGASRASRASRTSRTGPVSNKRDRIPDMNPSEPAPSDPHQAVASPVADSTETTRVAAHVGAASTPMSPDVTAVPPQEPTPVRPPGRLRLTFKLRLEDTSEILLDLDDSVDFRHGPYRQSIAIVGDQVRKV